MEICDPSLFVETRLDFAAQSVYSILGPRYGVQRILTQKLSFKLLRDLPGCSNAVREICGAKGRLHTFYPHRNVLGGFFFAEILSYESVVLP